ncbi:MAG: RNA polymerase subunit sigma-70 [Fibrella sp.]|nr:RNA polymerase subunit sigma-70 [Armatimonadota bacterium]
MATTQERAVEAALRESYGRLVAYLAGRNGDLAGAEDALSEAFVAALETWQRTGVPEKPEAWLLTVARNRILDGVRRAKRGIAIQTTFRSGVLDAQSRVRWETIWEATLEPSFPDERLKLLFLCAHPAIDPRIQTPLLLQTVLGIDAARIASAFLVAPATMGQRLVRAKAKIRDAGIRFEVPDSSELPERLSAVLEAIYAAYGTGWEDVTGAGGQRGFATEAISLTRLVVRLLPDEPEAMGLLALLLFCEARSDSRRDGNGGFVPLREQNIAQWDHKQILEAEQWLRNAARTQKMGRFQLEAAIQSAHIQQAVSGRENNKAIVILYEGLVRFAPTVGAYTAYAIATAEAHGAAAGLAILDTLPSEVTPGYQPYWVGRAYLLVALGRFEEARAAYRKAIGLSEDPAVRSYLTRRSGNIPTEELNTPETV